MNYADEFFRAWITKNALTSGIECVKARVSKTRPCMIIYGPYGFAYREGTDWHRTPEGALARAEEMRKAKIASLKKSIARLERLTFTAPDLP